MQDSLRFRDVLQPGPDYHHWGPKALNILLPHYGEPHIDVEATFFNGYLAVKKSGNFVARLQQNKLLFCERRRRERKFPIFKFSIAAVRRQFTHISEVGGPQMPKAQGQCLVCLVDDPSLTAAGGVTAVIRHTAPGKQRWPPSPCQ